MLKEIKQHIDAHELVDKNQPCPKFFLSCATGNTDKGHNKHIRRLLKFCMLAQDWNSAITLESKLSTEYFPSMDPDTTALCFAYKHDDRGSHLLKEDGVPVLDCEGKNVLCDGKWKNPGSKEQCFSATSKVRANHGQ